MMQSTDKYLFQVGDYGRRFLPVPKATLTKEMLLILAKPLIQYSAEERISTMAIFKGNIKNGFYKNKYLRYNHM